jgi:hypothetical protein
MHNIANCVSCFSARVLQHQMKRKDSPELLLDMNLKQDGYGLFQSNTDIFLNEIRKSMNHSLGESVTWPNFEVNTYRTQLHIVTPNFCVEFNVVTNFSEQVRSKRFWYWCIAFKITGFIDFQTMEKVHRPSDSAAQSNLTLRTCRCLKKRI